MWDFCEIIKFYSRFEDLIQGECAKVLPNTYINARIRYAFECFRSSGNINSTI